jgi:glutathione synthase/RimK-type ligase-like ATP-grasp enzyme
MRIALVHGSDRGIEGPDHASGPDRAVDAALHAELTRRSIAFDRPLWNDASVDWTTYDLAIVRTVWDYTRDREAFVTWAAAAAERTVLENPAEVLRWNTHKSYLLELEDRGAPVVPTAWLARGDTVDLAALCEQRGWDEVVLKPAVAAGSDGLTKVGSAPAARRSGQDRLEVLLDSGDVMVQPFRRNIRDGELSLVAIEGQVTHAVRKLPAEGDFRVQSRFGGSYAPEQPSADALALTEWILTAVGAPLLYARVDLIAADDGSLELSEVEATEPDLYLEHSGHGTTALVDAMVRRVESAPLGAAVPHLGRRDTR